MVACAKPLSLFDRVNESLDKGDAVSLISLEFSKRFGAGQQEKIFLTVEVDIFTNAVSDGYREGMRN